MSAITTTQLWKRQWRVLWALRAHSKSTTIPDLLQYLQATATADSIKGLTVRTLERDIQTLETAFGAVIVVNRTAKPYRVSWQGLARLDGGIHLTDAQAPALVLLQMRMGVLCPPVCGALHGRQFPQPPGLLDRRPRPSLARVSARIKPAVRSTARASTRTVSRPRHRKAAAR